MEYIFFGLFWGVVGATYYTLVKPWYEKVKDRKIWDIFKKEDPELSNEDDKAAEE